MEIKKYGKKEIRKYVKKDLWGNVKKETKMFLKSL